MLTKHAITALIAVTAPGVTAAFNTSCSWWWLKGQYMLTGDCIDSTSSNRQRVVSNLDLNDCIGVDTTANAMVWKPNGSAFRMLCGNCKMQSSAIVMQCDCTNILTDGKTSSSVNLNDRITVNEQGWLTCDLEGL